MPARPFFFGPMLAWERQSPIRAVVTFPDTSKQNPTSILDVAITLMALDLRLSFSNEKAKVPFGRMGLLVLQHHADSEICGEPQRIASGRPDRITGKQAGKINYVQLVIEVYDVNLHSHA